MVKSPASDLVCYSDHEVAELLGLSRRHIVVALTEEFSGPVASAEAILKNAADHPHRTVESTRKHPRTKKAAR
jgi:hypothetical protein